MRITLTNTFHGTSVRLNAAFWYEDRAVLNMAQVARARKTLCPVKGCTCRTDMLGQRGESRWVVTAHSEDFVKVEPASRVYASRPVI